MNKFGRRGRRINSGVVPWAAVACSIVLCGWSFGQAATVPPAIGAAKTVFIANAGEEENVLSEQAYATLSQEIAQAGHYKVVFEPAAAELIYELHYVKRPNIVTQGNSGDLFEFHLLIWDRATHVPLWATTEGLDPNAFKGNFDSRFHQSFAFALQRLGEDVRLLSLGQLPSTNTMNPQQAKKH